MTTQPTTEKSPPTIPQPIAEASSCNPLNLIITALVITTLGLLAAGGYFLFATANTIMGWSLLGGGLFLACIVPPISILLSSRSGQSSPTPGRPDPVPPTFPEYIEGSSAVLSIIEVRPHPVHTPGVYSALFWNVGTEMDYANICFLRDQIDAGKSLSAAFSQLPKQTEPALVPSEADAQARPGMFRETLTVASPDLIFLADTWEMGAEELKAMLPPDYLFVSHQDGARRNNCTVAWKMESFTLLDHRGLTYTKEMIPPNGRKPNTLVRLQDREGKKIAAIAGHLEGFNLNFAELPDVERAKALEAAKLGDKQLESDLTVLNSMEADLHIYAADFNADRSIYPKRFTIIEGMGYKKAPVNSYATVYDVHVKDAAGDPSPLRLDEIYFKGAKLLEQKCIATISLDTNLRKFLPSL